MSKYQVSHDEHEVLLEDEQQRLYEVQGPVGKQDLYKTPAFTWLEMKELGHTNRMVLLTEKFHPDDVILAVVDVATGDGVWCTPDQVVRIDNKLSAPRAALSNLFRTKAIAKPGTDDSKKGVKRKFPERDSDTFPWSEDFNVNVKEILENSARYTERQIARVINRMVDGTIVKRSQGCLCVKEAAGSAKHIAVGDSMVSIYYLDGTLHNEDSVGEEVFDLCSKELTKLFEPLGLAEITYKNKSISLAWMSRHVFVGSKRKKV